MDMNTYQELAARTIPEGQSLNELLTNFCLGLAGESGELIDHIKKHVYHGHPLDLDYVAKELGDLQWYNAALARVLGMSWSQIGDANIRKLLQRYPVKFNHEESRNREENGA